ncbi:MAG: sulfide/dihydroorotate dehydrogenase-like FAD/NAD-binding protein [Deltaproteobacteria bacterium]|nr:sulfide/dihydroorotate dehydrogenase-like FAD/NAD-binding protein [Deltaproteobacteria bacterium]
MYKILEREEMAQGTVVRNVIEAPKIAAKAKPGQFVIIKANETGERIPLTMADTDAEKGTITIIYQVVGKSTALFKSFEVGESFQDVLGPLGQPTHIEKVDGLVLCVGGGTGTAVVHPITKGFKNAGNKVVAIVGSRNKDLLILEDKMAAASEILEICTDDGSYGHHGFVTDVLKKYLEGDEKVGLVVTAGPVPMMKFVARMTKEFGVKTLVSLNSIMIDGTGMCGGCRVSVGGESRFACVEGPEFDGHQVDFDELTMRLGAYKDMEAEAMKKYEEDCRIGLDKK